MRVDHQVLRVVAPQAAAEQYDITSRGSLARFNVMLAPRNNGHVKSASPLTRSQNSSRSSLR